MQSNEMKETSNIHVRLLSLSLSLSLSTRVIGPGRVSIFGHQLVSGWGREMIGNLGTDHWGKVSQPLTQGELSSGQMTIRAEWGSTAIN